MRAVLPPGELLPALALVSIVFLIVMVVLIWLVRSLELRLFALGLLTAVLALWAEAITGPTGASVQIPAGPQAQVGSVVIGGEAGRALGRIAILLILGGIAVSLLSKWNAVGTYTSREEASRGNQP